MDTKDCIFHFVNCESRTPVDLGQAYLKENDIFEDERICRLCMQFITCGFTSVEELDVDMLRRYIPRSKVPGENKEVICNSCRRKLNEALEFRSTCLNTDKKIIPHKDCESMLQLDLGEVYMKENGNGHLTDISYDHKICRLCMQLIEDEVRCIGEEELQAIHKLIPEMNIEIIKDPVVCKACFDSLCTHDTFLKACSEKQQRITDISESLGVESRAVATPSGIVIKTENLDNESEINEEEMPIKTECVDIKSEVGASDTVLLCSKSETFENSECKNEKEVGHEYMWKHKNRSIAKRGMKTRKNGSTFHQLKSDKSLYKCGKCSYETKNKRYFTSHYARHKIVLEEYKCDTCDYVCKKKKSLRRHMVRHKDPSQVQMYKCDACDYESRYKNHFIGHQLTHKDPSQVEMYRCDECEFKTKYKKDLTNHVLRHKDPSQIQMYKCDACDYETRHNKYFTTHQLMHKDPSQVRMYKCAVCDYESRYKYHLTAHQLKHQDPSEVYMYKCNDCGYKTKHKRSLACHKLRHKDPSQVQMHKCGACNYETRYKGNLMRHELSHKT